MATSKKKPVASVETPKNAAASATEAAVAAQARPVPAVESSIRHTSAASSAPSADTAAATSHSHKASHTSKKPAISAAQRHHYVQVAAYYIAERRGFAAGDPVADWSAAEAEIDRLLASGHWTD